MRPTKVSLVLILVAICTLIHAQNGPKAPDFSSALAQFSSLSKYDKQTITAEKYEELCMELGSLRKSLPLIKYDNADSLTAKLLQQAKTPNMQEAILACFPGFIGKKTLAAASKVDNAETLQIAKERQKKIQTIRKKLSDLLHFRAANSRVGLMLAEACKYAPNGSYFGTPLLSNKQTELVDIKNVIAAHLVYKESKIGKDESPVYLFYLVKRQRSLSQDPTLMFAVRIGDDQLFYELPLTKGTPLTAAVLDNTRQALTEEKTRELMCYLTLCEHKTEQESLRKSGWIGSYQTSQYVNKSMTSIKGYKGLNAWIKILNILAADDFSIPEEKKQKDYEIGPNATKRINAFVALVEQAHEAPNPTEIVEQLTQKYRSRR